jgi:hypothetical protein
MTKYIWITVGMISLIIALGIKQSPKTDDIEQLTESASESQEIQYQVSESGNIKISSPKNLDKVQSPILVSGEAFIFGDGLKIELKDSTGKIISEKIVEQYKQESEEEFVQFAELLIFEDVQTGQGVLSIMGVEGVEFVDSIDLEVRF